ncbi:MAG: PorV/PorQ family protein, partial [Bacteroidota bacterium]
GIGISYMNYGELRRTDLLGNDLGTFRPQDFLIYLSKSHRISSFVLGASVKYVHTSIDGFGANAFVMDMGGSYHHPTLDFVASIVLKNLGFSFATFDSGQIPVPLDLQVGIGFKPRYMPARFTINAHHLVDNELDYFDESVLDGNTAAFGNRLFRHINIGMEILIGRFMNLLVGYNHLRNQELKLEQGAFGAGFSLGFMIKIKGLNLRYSRAIYHTGGGLNSIGLEGNFSEITKIF